MRLAPLVSRTSDTPRPHWGAGGDKEAGRHSDVVSPTRSETAFPARHMVPGLLVSWPSQPLGKAPLCSR